MQELLIQIQLLKLVTLLLQTMTIHINLAYMIYLTTRTHKKQYQRLNANLLKMHHEYIGKGLEKKQNNQIWIGLLQGLKIVIYLISH
ncbi:hypothetical protein AOX72_03545 [Salmonella enterica subsp. enterica serovar Derby]|nr:hypothetical protein AOX72_03545 [Salmonella enterica subsp. enterica serovar Derby]